MHIALLTNQLAITDGVSNHLFYLVNGFQKVVPEFRFTIITANDNARDKFTGQFNGEILVMPELDYERRSTGGFIKLTAKLAMLAKQKHFTIFHSHTHYLANIARYAGLIAGVKTIQTNHGLFPDGGRLPHYNAEHYICVSRHLEHYMLKNNFAKGSRCNFIGHGIEALPISSNRMQSDKICFIAAGRMIYNKGFDTYISAVAGLPPEIKNKCVFYLAGSGEERESLEAFNIESEAGVIFLGDVQQIREIYAKCDVYIHMTRSTEGSPVGLAEAALSGCYIITALYPGIETFYSVPLDGSGFALNDTKALQQAIIRYCQTPNAFHEVRNNFYKKCEELFGVTLMVEKTANVYRRILK